MSKNVTVFIAGVTVGIEFHRIFVKITKYNDRCAIEGCHYRAFSYSPGGVVSAMQQHYKEKHPGWKSVYQV